jgi:hypothetical protein
MTNFLKNNLKNPFVGFTNPFFWLPSGKNLPQKKTLMSPFIYIHIFQVVCFEEFG